MSSCFAPLASSRSGEISRGHDDPIATGRCRLGERLDERGAIEWFDGTWQSPSPIRVRIGREKRCTGPDSPGRTGLAWEADVRERAQHLGIPRVIERFRADEFEYLVLEDPAGISLWDAWDDPSIGAADRFSWLVRLADCLRSLHAAAAIVESLRPEQVRVTPLGQVVLSAEVVLLPLPLAHHSFVRRTLTSAPELHLGEPVDARADLYHFGSVLYALHLGRELTELDFVGPGEPRAILARDPDIHPCLGRLLARTFTPIRTDRFSSNDLTSDFTGFEQLIRTLEAAQRVLGRVRLDISAWTTTGMVRGNNEDAAAIVQGVETGEPGDDWALIALADGMGGYAAGEVASAITVQTIRRCVLCSPELREIIGRSPPPEQDRSRIAESLVAALREANRVVCQESREEGRHGMGCTAEAVFVDGRQVVVAHVGDSRVYRLHRGELRQLTRDQTYLNRLLESEQITWAEARVHPRRGELMQAIGGRADVVPEVIAAPFTAGDWLLVCSDGLTARLAAATIRDMIETATSADAAARRLINRANLEGAGDNVSVVLVRAC